jgi:hypothetical protein
MLDSSYTNIFVDLNFVNRFYMYCGRLTESTERRTKDVPGEGDPKLPASSTLHLELLRLRQPNQHAPQFVLGLAWREGRRNPLR